jgi:nucleoid-associated protein YgaU
MALEKLKILAEVRAKPRIFAPLIEALFNPNQLSITKTTHWKATPTPESDTSASKWMHGNPSTLNLDLFFDTYETGMDVRQYTQQVVFLAEIKGEFHRPPICQLVWGELGVFFQGVLQSLNQNYTLFLADGTPVRATLKCTFQEWTSEDEQAKRDNKQSVDVVKTRIVRRGDTLSSIAAEEYNDPALWRPIAEANQIDDPLSLSPGRPLILPTLPVRGTGRR